MTQIENINHILAISKFSMRSIVSDKFYTIQKNDAVGYLLKSSISKILEAGKVDTTILDLSKDHPQITLGTDLKELTATMYILSQSEVDEIRKQLELINDVCNK